MAKSVITMRARLFPTLSEAMRVCAMYNADHKQSYGVVMKHRSGWIIKVTDMRHGGGFDGFIEQEVNAP